MGQALMGWALMVPGRLYMDIEGGALILGLVVPLLGFVFSTIYSQHGVNVLLPYLH